MTYFVCCDCSYCFLVTPLLAAGITRCAVSGYLFTGSHYSQRRAALHQRLLQQVPAGRRLLQAPQEDVEQLRVVLRAPAGLLGAQRPRLFPRAAAPPLTVHLQVLKGQTQVGLQGGTELSCQRPHLEEEAKYSQK